MTENNELLIEQLNKFVAYAGKIVKRATLPILESVFIENGTIRGTDLQTTVVMPVDIEGTFTIRLAMLKKVLESKPKTLSMEYLGDEINIGRSGLKSKAARVVYDGKELTFATKTEEFPSIPSGDFESLGSWLRPVIEQLLINKKYCSTDDLKPSLSGIFIKQSEQRLQMCATDGHKLRWVQDMAVDSGEFEGIINTDWLKMISKKALGKNIAVMSNREGVKPSLKTEVGISSAIKICFDGIEMYSRLIEERYPDYKGVIPMGDKIAGTVRINRDEFAAMVKDGLGFCNRTTHGGQFNFANNSVKLRAEDIEMVVNWEQSMVTEQTGPELEIGYNMNYLKTVLSDLEPEHFNYEYGAPVQAAIIRTDLVSGGNATALLMPIRLND